MNIIDAHSHLWLRQDTTWNGLRISPMPNGRSMFLGEERQMLPPFMIDGVTGRIAYCSGFQGYRHSWPSAADRRGACYAEQCRDDAYVPLYGAASCDTVGHVG